MGVAVGTTVGVDVAVALGVGEAVAVAVAVGEAVGVGLMRGVGVGVEVGVWVAVGVAVGVGVGDAEMLAHCENSEVSSSWVSLHLPALPALTIDWTSACESARRKTSTSSICPFQKYLSVGQATAIDPILF